MSRNYISMRFLIVLLLVCLSHQGFCDLLENTSVSGTSLGGCFYPGDISSAFYNPAGLMFIQRSHVIASHYLLFDGAKFNLFGYQERFNKFAFGLVFAQLYRDNIEVRKTLSDDPEYTYSTKTAGLLSLTGMLPYKIVFGGSIKTVYYDMYNTKSDRGLGLDLGFSKEFFKLGSRFKNQFAFTGAIGFLNLSGLTVNVENEKETYSPGVRSSVNIGVTLFPKYDIEKEILIHDTIRIFIDSYQSKQTTRNFGLEYNYRNKLDIRAGLNNNHAQLGFGINFGNVKLNYAVIPREYTVLHFLDIVYSFGEIHEIQRTPDELDDYLKVLKKAERIYGKYLRDATEFAREKKYDSAKQLLVKIIPLFPQKQAAKELLNLCENSVKAENLKSLNSKYQQSLKLNNFTQVFKFLLDAVDIAPLELITKNMLTDFESKELTGAVIQQIKEKQQRFVREVNKKIDEAIRVRDYDKAYFELNKLEIIEANSENTHVQKNKVSASKKEYLKSLLTKAVTLQKDKNFGEAYCHLKEAYRVSKDESINFQLEQSEEQYIETHKVNPTEELYQKKLYFLSGISFALDEPPKARQLFYELKNRNFVFNYTQLEEALIKNKIIERGY